MTDTEQHEVTLMLKENHLRAMELRFLGHSYADIASEIDMHEETVKNWFRRGSRVYSVYKDFCEEVSRELREKLLNRIMNTSNTALERLVSLMNNSKNEQIQLRASMYILDKTLPYAFDEREKEEIIKEKITEMMVFYDLDPESLTEKDSDFKQFSESFQAIKANI